MNMMGMKKLTSNFFWRDMLSNQLEIIKVYTLNVLLSRNIVGDTEENVRCQGAYCDGFVNKRENYSF